MDINTHAEHIKQWIAIRKMHNEITQCIFLVTTPKIHENKNEDPTLKKVQELFKKNGVETGFVDTVGGAWNLNRDWLESGKMDCIVEYCGVYPINWDVFDVIELERMDTEGEIIIQVYWIDKEGHFIANH